MRLQRMSVMADLISREGEGRLLRQTKAPSGGDSEWGGRVDEWMSGVSGTPLGITIGHGHRFEGRHHPCPRTDKRRKGDPGSK